MLSITVYSYQVSISIQAFHKVPYYVHCYFCFILIPVLRMLMYADDTTLFCNINNDINENEINRQLNTISEWLLSNKLSLNIKKTKYMVFHTTIEEYYIQTYIYI